MAEPTADVIAGAARPLGTAEGGVEPAAADVARWVGRARDAGLEVGDRIVCALAPGPAFLAVHDMARALGLVFAPTSPGVAAEGVAGALAARWLVASPADQPVAFSARAPAAPGVRYLIATSGSTGAPRWLALSDANVEAVLASHAEPLGFRPSEARDAVVLSVLPWHHVFGLVLEMNLARRGGARLVRDPAGGRDADRLLALAASCGATHLSCVPHTIRRVARTPGGRAWLRTLRGGVVGGAPVDGEMTDALAGTRLRVGYGQTEASPGIALGAPGEFRPDLLGRPVGCDVRLDPDGELAFRGANACLGEWHPTADDDGPPRLERLPADRWVRTGDLARQESDGTYTFCGRSAESFKLENGRYVAPRPIEAAVRARFPAVDEIVLWSPDGVGIVVSLSAAGAVPAVAELRALLGPLGARPVRVVQVGPPAWRRTPKGEIDRRAPHDL